MTNPRRTKYAHEVWYILFEVTSPRGRVAEKRVVGTRYHEEILKTKWINTVSVSVSQSLENVENDVLVCSVSKVVEGFLILFKAITDISMKLTSRKVTRRESLGIYLKAAMPRQPNHLGRASEEARERNKTA